GMNHFVIGNKPMTQLKAQNSRYCDDAIAMLFQKINQQGHQLGLFNVWLFGGASMFPAGQLTIGENVGRENIACALEVVKQCGINLTGQDLGGKSSRRVSLNTDTGEIIVMKDEGEKNLSWNSKERK
ncbi:MAG: chemotaxis protein CheD, partial [Gammaproteobacteria bacterium]|nr:chemotaxis protein CheD [Gammaproteobacteria bacterium]